MLFRSNIVFLEPASVLDSNNKLKELKFAEAREIRKVLIDLTHEINIQGNDLQKGNEFLAKIDLLWAKSRLSTALAGAKPRLSDNKLQLLALKHPLLVAVNGNQKRRVVSHNITLDNTNRMLIIRSEEHTSELQSH